MQKSEERKQILHSSLFTFHLPQALSLQLPASRTAVATVAAKFSRQFSDEVSWQKVDPQAAAAASGEEDITEGGGDQGGGSNGGGGNNNPPGELEE